MPNSRDLVPAGLWPLQPHTPQGDPGQGAAFVPPPSSPAASPNFPLDYGSPEAAAVLRSWAEPHALQSMRRQPPTDQSVPLATGDPYWQMLADAKASHDLMVALLGMADAAPRSLAKGVAAEKLSPARSDEQSPPVPPTEQ